MRVPYGTIRVNVKRCSNAIRVACTRSVIVGTIKAFFHADGKTQLLRDMLKRGRDNTGAHMAINLDGITSVPTSFEGSSISKTLKTWSSLN